MASVMQLKTGADVVRMGMIGMAMLRGVLCSAIGPTSVPDIPMHSAVPGLAGCLL